MTTLKNLATHIPFSQIRHQHTNHQVPLLILYTIKAFGFCISMYRHILGINYLLSILIPLIRNKSS
ncbi:hypothetical protein PICMEDRAFT_157794 [Pichia membranifaciens NRRL Y-2026]|uniref:Uncharacterized protein n=1 Tax=Pichia membranifaciens NRRL Y-2026 TaxID=763406 RepID=A0A1E3NFQ0_9ASCO|nr:hypothetical protein PICMEDRAFT_157794 [Pichia membranifaciens NRRL Y-2026]ODQ44961.1 hypothetical protein PICMEDRAFT_157794 [Pichia membranifaciens NRRL Y-2026]